MTIEVPPLRSFPVSLALSRAINPTLYLVHAAPQLLAATVVYPGVGKNLMRGADLFMPGVVMKDVRATNLPLENESHYAYGIGGIPKNHKKILWSSLTPPSHRP